MRYRARGEWYRELELKKGVSAGFSSEEHREHPNTVNESLNPKCQSFKRFAHSVSYIALMLKCLQFKILLN